jgi:hypothetical protein
MYLSYGTRSVLSEPLLSLENPSLLRLFIPDRENIVKEKWSGNNPFTEILNPHAIVHSPDQDAGQFTGCAKKMLLRVCSAPDATVKGDLRACGDHVPEPL